MNNKTVLVCDSDEKSLASIKSALSEQDFNVKVTTNPQELIEDAETHRAAIVIVNPDLPNFNASDACKYLQNERGVPVVFLMESNSTTRVRMDGCEADEVITKPLALEDMALRVAKLYALNEQ
jgi:DNA-binding response OmpR family regulator